MAVDNFLRRRAVLRIRIIMLVDVSIGMTLSKDSASYITGQIIRVNGGKTAV